ncbi:MAG: hypothetical protein LBQ66_01785 [Planctomycetaceae bacterium]|jgi:hypothetical protein|nr:hypothetical protein [Planctomycetaceae bacterium]
MSTYDEMNFKIPIESHDYRECSDYVIDAVRSIVQHAIDSGNNKIIINTNLRLGLPMENINNSYYAVVLHLEKYCFVLFC